MFLIIVKTVLLKFSSTIPFIILWVTMAMKNLIMDSFKNFVDFQNPFCDCHSKLDLCDIFVLKRLVWS